jgi:hypothetical protein
MTANNPVSVELIGSDKVSVDTQPASALFQTVLTLLLRMNAGVEGEGDYEECRRLLDTLEATEGLAACQRVMGAFFRLEWERQTLPRQ